jgi:trimeric autotransporter adhesin
MKRIKPILCALLWSLMVCVTPLRAQNVTLNIKPLASSDDAEQTVSTGSVNITSSDLELSGFDNAVQQITGIRFPNVTLPQGATLVNAYIQFSVNQTYAGTTNTSSIIVKAQRGNAATYTTANSNISGRTYTTAQVNWATAAWTAANQRLAAQRTPDIRTLITEAIQTGWTSGNALAFSFSTTATSGFTTAISFDGAASAASVAELVIVYTPAAALSVSADKPSGTYAAPLNVALTATAGATIRYTTNGVNPTATTGTVYSAPIIINATTNLRAIAVSGANISPVLSLNYTIQTGGGTTTARFKVLASSDDAEETTGTGTVSLSSSDLELGGYDYSSNTAQITGIRFPNVILPTGATITNAYIQFSVDELYPNTPSTADITIKAQRGNAATYTAANNNISSRTYTTAQTTWATPAWTVLDQRLVAQQTPDIKTLINEAIQTGWVSGNALAFSFTAPIAGHATAWAFDANSTTDLPELVIEYTTNTTTLTVNADRPSGTYTAPFNVVLTATAGATIRYTTNGTDPTATTGTVYSAPIAINATTNLKAIAVSGANVSTVLNLNYTITPLSISVDKPSGTYTAPLNVVLTATSGATIRYTTNGTDPTATTGTVYSAPIVINATTTLKAIAVLGGNISSVLTLNYTIQTGGTTTARFQITAGSDDAEEMTAAGNIDLTSSDVELGGFDFGVNFAQTVGLRFPNVAIPATATITRAYIQFSAKEASGTPLAISTIKMQNSITALTFTSATNNITTRAFSTNSVVWNTPNWTVASQRTAAQQTPDISPLINQVLSANGRTPSMSFVFTLGATTAGWANAWSVEGSPTNAPELVIEYTTSGGGKVPLTNVFINEATGSPIAGNKLDMIEILNKNTASISLDSVYVSDSRNNLRKFGYPNGQSIAANAFRVLSADGDLVASTATTAAFGISDGGETVYLSQQVNGVLVIIDSLVVGATLYNTTYGRFPDASSNVIAFTAATPAATNNNSKQLYNITFSNLRGVYTTAFNLTLTAPAGTTVRYTTNNTKPTATLGTIYSGSIVISSSTVVRAFAFNTAGESKVITQTYVFPSTVAQQLTLPIAGVETALKDLPFVSITTTGVIDTLNIPCTFEYVNKFGDIRSSYADAQFKIFGNPSVSQLKKSYRVSFKASLGFPKFKHNIFTRLTDETYNPSNEFDALELRAGGDVKNSTNLNDYYSHTLLRKMGSKDIHVSYVNVMVNGTYYGVCPIREKFDNDYAAEYYPGSDEEFDYLQTYDTFLTWPTVNDVYVEPGDGSLTQFQGVLDANAANNYQLLKQRMDVTHYTNSLLMFLAGDSEAEFKAVIGTNYSTPMTFFMKDMDYYIDSDGGGNTQATNLANNNKGPLDLLALSGMGGGTANLEYRTLVKDRFQLTYVVPKGAMTRDTVAAVMLRGRALIEKSMPLEIARWQRNPDSWFEKIDRFIDGLPTRLLNVRNKFNQFNLVHTLQAVTFSRASGTLAAGERVFITNPNAGTVVYYTTDSTDVVFNNVLSPTAKLYNATTGIVYTIGKNNVRARAFATGNFGMYADAVYTATALPLMAQNTFNFTAEGRQEGHNVALKWVSNANKQADYYVVERLNAVHQGFDTVAYVNAQYSNSANSVHFYTYLDENPQPEDNIYRIGVKMNNQDFKYTPFINVPYTAYKDAEIYPNPATDEVRLDLSIIEQRKATITLMDAKGHSIERKEFEKAPNSVSFKVQGLPAGQYYLHIQAKGRRDAMKKVVIKGY